MLVERKLHNCRRREFKRLSRKRKSIYNRSVEIQRKKARVDTKSKKVVNVGKAERRSHSRVVRIQINRVSARPLQQPPHRRQESDQMFNSNGAAIALLELAQAQGAAFRAVDQELLATMSGQQQNNPAPGAPGINISTTPGQSADINQLITAMTALMQQNTILVETVNRNQNQGIQNYNVLPDLSHNIADFDGLSGAAEAKVWLKQLESSATLLRWTEPIAFETARSHLKKAAKNWYIASMDTIVDWKSFRKIFSSTFMMEKTLTEKWEEMQKRYQKPGEGHERVFFR